MKWHHLVRDVLKDIVVTGISRGRTRSLTLTRMLQVTFRVHEWGEGHRQAGWTGFALGPPAELCSLQPTVPGSGFALMQSVEVLTPPAIPPPSISQGPPSLTSFAPILGTPLSQLGPAQPQ
ncbi:hypothetical protein GHT09_007679 [Marmota monax]|uniref:Uncharacterized protein n=1 Tax=Marmota monax TaxID=9995 RepID=A0A834PR72_MARMO|nr:hypothetical protein GHT09_007679 [Marmota monax]